VEGWIIDYPKIKDTIKSEAKIGITGLNSNKINTSINLMLESGLQKPVYSFLDNVSCKGILQMEKSFEKDYFSSEGLDGRIICDKVEIINTKANMPFVKPIVDYKNAIVQKAKQYLNQPYSDLLFGMIFGDDAQMSSHLKNDIRNSGTAHIIAASGYNINLVVSLAFILNKNFKRNYLVVFSDVLLGLYLVLVGFDNVPAKRAIIMQIYLTTAWIFGKKPNIYYSFTIGILVLLLENIYVYKSLSFLLSFFATLGIIMFFKPLRTLINRFINDIWLCEAIAITVVASIATIPVLVLFFGKVSIISVLSNVLISPLIPLIFYIGFVFLILIALGVQSLFLNYIIYCMLDILIKIVDFLGGLDFATFTFDSYVYLPAILMLLICVLWFINLFKKRYYG
jgi:competence protein ComEC